jgi:hypothetical protein
MRLIPQGVPLALVMNSSWLRCWRPSAENTVGGSGTKISAKTSLPSSVVRKRAAASALRGDILCEGGLGGEGRSTASQTLVIALRPSRSSRNTRGYRAKHVIQCMTQAVIETARQVQRANSSQVHGT